MPAGNINSIIDPIRGNQTFSYDSLNRLITASGPYGPVNYSYNPIGNMLSNSQVGVYSYNASGPASVRPHAVTGAGVDSYTYDANGNMTGGAGRTLTYDTENRPTQITQGGVTTDLVYDGDGGRVMKTAGGVSTVYVGKLYVCEAGLCSRMIFANGQRIAEVETLSGAPRYYHTDHLGSTGVVTDSFGNNIQDLTYHPYGDTFSNAGSVDLAYKYTGKELDDSTDLYFYEARYYDANLARFISADTLVPDPSNPQAFNRYAYALNNPIRYNDPSGHYVSLATQGVLQSNWLTSDSGLNAGNSFGPTFGANPSFIPQAGGMVFSQNFASHSGIFGASRINDSFGLFSGPFGQSIVRHQSLYGDGDFEVGFGSIAVDTGLFFGEAGFYAFTLGEGAVALNTVRFTLQKFLQKFSFEGIKKFFSGKAANETTTLFRAVGNSELGDIISRQAFRNLRGFEGKYFSETAEGAASFAKQSHKTFGNGPFTTIKTTIPKNAINSSMKTTADRGIPTVVIPTNKLPQLSKPQVLDISPIP